MNKTGTYTVWCKSLEPLTRWHPLSHFQNITKEDAEREVANGEKQSHRFGTYLRYAACDKGESPDASLG